MSLIFTQEGYLTPVGKITTDLPTLERVFVTAFPTSTTRPRLWANYKAFLEHFRQKVTGNFVQWLNGSFVTQKENPKDIDLVTFIDYSIYEPMEAQQRLEEFWTYNLEDKGLDSYLLGVYPEGHALYLEYQDFCSGWATKYTNTKQNGIILEKAKGFVELNFTLSSWKH
ncbi:MAG: hypothetical protein EAZ95_18835 [Bacteroidetes bacterium]|nr:MAG: hypothetical protein EAZ95_18835 [Bacteroidota bacterium]